MAVPPLDPPDARDLLRTNMKKLRKSLDKQIKWVSPALPEALRSVFRESDVIGLYAPISGEPDPAVIPFGIAKLTSLPARAASCEMAFRRWQFGEPLVTSLWGGFEPADTCDEIETDVIFVPLVAFDAQLNRLGQGGGHYDRYLAAHPGARRIGVAWDAQRVAALAPQPWDIALDAVITEKHCYLKDLQR